MSARDRTTEPRENDSWMTIDPRPIPALLERAPTIRNGAIWEPAAGTGEMVRRLQDFGCSVVFSGLIDGRDSVITSPRDFFSYTKAPGQIIKAIVTNPPNNLNLRFAIHALELMKPVRGIVALYQRHEWDTTQKTAPIFDHPAFAMKIVCRFRPIWVKPKPNEKPVSPYHRWSWYVWDWRHNGHPIIKFSHGRMRA